MDNDKTLIWIGKRGRWLLRHWKVALPLLLFLIWFYFSLPSELFDATYSPVLLSERGHLLDARVAEDHQWRFPPIVAPLPERYLKALVVFEDQRFFHHPGVDFLAVARAIKQNLAGRTRISGASTLTMQLIRLARKAPRTWWNKIYETLLALRLELRLSKAEILHLYATHAPMGRNVVGVWAAAWLYFNRPPIELSWAESALLAVLPNAPSDLSLDRGRTGLLQKRNRLLGRLSQLGIINPLTRDLALAEPLPSGTGALAQRWAVHLLDTLNQGTIATRPAPPLFHSSVDLDLQKRAEDVVAAHQARWAKSRINDLCALVVDHRTGGVKAYVGNGAYLNGQRGESAWLDLIPRQRSTGSILKPFLYAAMFQEGELTPQQLVEDVPIFIRGFSPQNFDRNYLGAVPAHSALAYSLNIPAVRLLQQHGLQRFYDRLKAMGMESLHRPADHYGLTLILGGAEGSLWNMAQLYSRLAQVALDQQRGPTITPLSSGQGGANGAKEDWPIGRGAAYLTLQALTEVARPGLEGYWQTFASSRLISWKTGTSQGFRDGWAFGMTPQHTLAVWVGNADGEGRPEISGLTVAAPVLFDLYQLLPAGDAFPMAVADLKSVTLCRESGYLPGPNCPERIEALLPKQSRYQALCPFHQSLFLDRTGRYRVDSRCETVYNMKQEDRFVLPPVLAYYFSRWHPEYRPLPPWREDCAPIRGAVETMSLIYPPPQGMVYIPRELDGQLGAVVFRLIHQNPERLVHWHIDERFQGSTRHFHEMTLAPDPGQHLLTLVDETGLLLQRRFTVLEKGETN